MPDSPTPKRESDFVCDCEEQMHSACKGELFYKEHEGKRYCVLHFPGKEKSVDFKASLQRKLDKKDFDFGGVWFPDELSFYKVDFSAGANFSKATFSADVHFSDATFSVEAKFRYAIFSAWADFEEASFVVEADFYRASFNWAYFPKAKFNVKTDFNSATFNAAADFSSATFGAQADFNRAEFKVEADFGAAAFWAKANFGSAKFWAEANFYGTDFRMKADFINTAFKARAVFREVGFSEEAYFILATFSAEADFLHATFGTQAKFSQATFSDYVNFAGNKRRVPFSDSSSLDLQFARIEKPDHVSFHTLTLHPHWFVNVDARKLDFTNVNWQWRNINEEVGSVRGKKTWPPPRLLAVAFRHLAVNAEENHRYEEASKFRYMAMDALRVETWRGFVPWRLSWWYWFASGYGERILRALVVFVGIWLIFALLYSNANLRCSSNRQDPCIGWEKPTAEVDTKSRFDTVWSSAMYTLEVMALQKPDPHPKSTLAHLAVTLCAILGPLQGALLALAIRRKFMR